MQSRCGTRTGHGSGITSDILPSVSFGASSCMHSLCLSHCSELAVRQLRRPSSLSGWPDARAFGFRLERTYDEHVPLHPELCTAHFHLKGEAWQIYWC